MLGLAQLFRILRNAGGADWLNPLGPVATQGGIVAAVENTAPSPGGSVGTGGATAAGERYRRQRSRPLFLAKAKALSVGLSNAYFKSPGLPSLSEEF